MGSSNDDALNEANSQKFSMIHWFFYSSGQHASRKIGKFAYEQSEKIEQRSACDFNDDADSWHWAKPNIFNEHIRDLNCILPMKAYCADDKHKRI